MLSRRSDRAKEHFLLCNSRARRWEFKSIALLSEEREGSIRPCVSSEEETALSPVEEGEMRGREKWNRDL
ncbi:hypothetical protein PRIPAC_84296 [Pristionchus pacificus]|uniref:Uncharacterized protein n=1 Tax=Pristionchus pacificus TaxID=54126 RepID=A0A2A6BIA4_PRIPA|nr:hypothetical protein PRIPAC_84296 [Pristionchus pacificus]|eukprot:PDM65619.1 hypothetical protein PRIPAC_53627 [Pristionchus pacificus]